MVHSHRGRSSQDILDKGTILAALGIIPGQSILDAGCGNGYMAKEFARLMKGSGRVYALDPDSEAIAQLRAETAGTIIEPIEGDITRRTSLPSSSLDLVYLAMVFHGFSRADIPGFQAEATRLLKPHARLAIVEIHKRETPFGPPLEIRFSPEELRHAVALSPLETVQVGEHFYMQLFQNFRARAEDDKADSKGQQTKRPT